MSVALGLPIVTEQWVSASSKAGKLLNTDKFIPQVPAEEQDWGFSMQAIIYQPQADVFKTIVASIDRLDKELRELSLDISGNMTG